MLRSSSTKGKVADSSTIDPNSQQTQTLSELRALMQQLRYRQVLVSKTNSVQEGAAQLLELAQSLRDFSLRQREHLQK